jgi:hypothetical protein
MATKVLENWLPESFFSARVDRVALQLAARWRTTGMPPDLAARVIHRVPPNEAFSFKVNHFLPK